jgi:ribosomal protein L44E
LTNTDAYFNYLEHQTELHHIETEHREPKTIKEHCPTCNSMTPTKIRMIKLQKREEQEAIRAARKETRDDARRAEEERLKEKEHEREPARKQAEILYRKHFDSTHVNRERRGSTAEKKRSRTLFTNVTKHFRDIQTRDERDEARELKVLPREEMTEEQKYEADILQVDSLMYIPAEVGDSESA